MPDIEEGRERLFIGVPVPKATQLLLMRQLPSTLPGRATPPENWHFTLKFLGSTDRERRDHLIENLRTARLGTTFDMEFDNLGAFPNAKRARVLWVGVGNGHERLERVAEQVELAAAASGFDREARKFTAHLTVSRMREPVAVHEFLDRARKVRAQMRVEEVILYRSEPGGPHSRYTVVAGFPLN